MSPALAKAIKILLYLRIQTWHGLTGKQNKFLRIVNSHAPFRVRRTKLSKAPWINSTLMKGMRSRDAPKRKVIRTKNPQDWANLFTKIKFNQSC